MRTRLLRARWAPWGTGAGPEGGEFMEPVGAIGGTYPPRASKSMLWAGLSM